MQDRGLCGVVEDAMGQDGGYGVGQRAMEQYGVLWGGMRCCGVSRGWCLGQLGVLWVSDPPPPHRCPPASLIRGNRANCALFSTNLDWLVSKLDRLEASSGQQGPHGGLMGGWGPSYGAENPPVGLEPLHGDCDPPMGLRTLKWSWSPCTELSAFIWSQ